MSITSLLSVAQSALRAQERAVGVIGHNIANAETPGYTRQRARLAAQQPQDVVSVGQVGRGVALTGIERLRSGFFDDGWRREAGSGARHRSVAETLGQVSGILGEPSDAGIADGIDQLIDSFHSLASNPIDPTARAVTLASAQALVDRLRSIDLRLDGVAGNIGAELSQVVRDVNGLASEIANLNILIRKANGQAPDLLDRRDQAIDELSQLVDVRVVERGQGSVDVLLGGAQLVGSGAGSQPLSVTGAGPYQLAIGSPAVPVTVPAGGKATAGFELVRHVAKYESPLVQLKDNASIITSTAEVTFYGQDRVGNDVSARGNIQIDFGNFGDFR